MMEVEEICETLVFDTTDMADARDGLSTSIRRGRLEILTYEECVPPCGLLEECFHFGGA